MTCFALTRKKCNILVFVSNCTPTETECPWCQILGSGFSDSTVTFIGIFIILMSMTHIVALIIFRICMLHKIKQFLGFESDLAHVTSSYPSDDILVVACIPTKKLHISLTPCTLWTLLMSTWFVNIHDKFCSLNTLNKGWII